MYYGLKILLLCGSIRSTQCICWVTDNLLLFNGFFLSLPLIEFLQSGIMQKLSSTQNITHITEVRVRISIKSNKKIKCSMYISDVGFHLIPAKIVFFSLNLFPALINKKKERKANGT